MTANCRFTRWNAFIQFRIQLIIIITYYFESQIEFDLDCKLIIIMSHEINSMGKTCNIYLFNEIPKCRNVRIVWTMREIGFFLIQQLLYNNNKMLTVDSLVFIISNLPFEFIKMKNGTKFKMSRLTVQCHCYSGFISNWTAFLYHISIAFRILFGFLFFFVMI